MNDCNCLECCMRQIREGKVRVEQDREIKELADILVDGIIFQMEEEKKKSNQEETEKKVLDNHQTFYY